MTLHERLLEEADTLHDHARDTAMVVLAAVRIRGLADKLARGAAPIGVHLEPLTSSRARMFEDDDGHVAVEIQDASVERYPRGWRALGAVGELFTTDADGRVVTAFDR